MPGDMTDILTYRLNRPRGQFSEREKSTCKCNCSLSTVQVSVGGKTTGEEALQGGQGRPLYQVTLSLDAATLWHFWYMLLLNYTGNVCLCLVALTSNYLAYYTAYTDTAHFNWLEYLMIRYLILFRVALGNTNTVMMVPEKNCALCL